MWNDCEMKRSEKRYNTWQKIFLRNTFSGLLFHRNWKVLNAFRVALFPLKTKYIHLNDLKRTLTPKPPTTAPIITNVSGVPRNNTSTRQLRSSSTRCVEVDPLTERIG